MAKQQNLPNLKSLFDQLCENNTELTPSLTKGQFKKLLNIIGLLDTEIDIEDQEYSFNDVIDFIKTRAKNNSDTIKSIDLKRGINNSLDKDTSNYINTEYFNTEAKFIDNSTIDKVIHDLKKI